MKITPAEVEKTAELARLSLTDDEVERLTRELGDILGYMEILGGIDVSGVEPMTHAVALECPLRDDDNQGQGQGTVVDLGTEAALAAAPRRDGAFFQVPRVMAHDKEGS